MILFEKVAILGAGLLGASLGLALKKKKLCKSVSVWSRSESSRAKCKDAPWCDEVFETPQDAVKNADLVVLCATIDAIKHNAEEIAPHLKAGAIVTDVGSTKGMLCEICGAFIKKSKGFFVGSHPMAGSEKSGMDYAKADLFDGRPCFVTPFEDAQNEAPAQSVKKFWEALGMNVSFVSPQAHDAIVARISHLPHIIANDLCVNVSKYSDVKMLKKFAASGFKDTTRVASGPADVWINIIEDNSEEICRALKSYIIDLSAFADAVEHKDFATVKKLLERGKQFRDSFNVNE